VPNGDYEVRLHNGEHNFTDEGGGDRIFDVFIEGDEVLPNFDPIVAAGGQYVAHTDVFSGVSVADGSLTIAIAAQTSVAIIRAVEIYDETPPVITLQGANPQSITAGNAYVELGATAVDNVDGDITGSIQIDSSAVNTNVVGSYQVTYGVSDAAGNAATQMVRTVNVTAVPDSTPPVITLLGANPQLVGLGSAYEEQGATASDNVDGNLTGDIVIDASAVNTAVLGTYPVSYSVEDSSGNDATVLRSVQVVDFFNDDNASIFEREINAIATAGITKGCNPPLNSKYCPEGLVTRGEAAAMFTRLLGLTVRSADPFTDDDGSIFEADIEKAHAAGITKGCNPPVNDRFCPDAFITRGEMAAVFVRAFNLTATSGTDLFVDDDSSIFEGDIDKLATAGVTRGCNPPVNDRFCPSDNITRGQFAAFIARQLGL